MFHADLDICPCPTNSFGGVEIGTSLLCLSIKKYPIVFSQQLMCNIHNARLNESRRVEDLSGHITARSNDNESVNELGQFMTILNFVSILVEDRYTAQFAAGPFCLVLSKFGVH
jgi:hypothetical protein